MNQNTKQKRSAASWLAELAKGRYGEYALSVLTALLGVACSLIPYFIIIRLITALVNGTAELPRCLTLCAWMAGCWVLRYVLHSVSTSLSHHATFHVLANTRVRLLDKLATLPLGTVLDRSSGSYKNIIVERVDSIETTLAHLLPEMTTNIVGAWCCCSSRTGAWAFPCSSSCRWAFSALCPCSAAITRSFSARSPRQRH